MSGDFRGASTLQTKESMELCRLFIKISFLRGCIVYNVFILVLTKSRLFFESCCMFKTLKTLLK